LPGSDASRILDGLAKGIARNGVITILLNPQHANALADAGWTKQKIVAYLCEHVQQKTLRRPLNPNDIRIVIAGGAGGLGACIISGGGFATKRTTSKIDLPGNWDQLVEKYWDIDPHDDGDCGCSDPD